MSRFFKIALIFLISCLIIAVMFQTRKIIQLNGMVIYLEQEIEEAREANLQKKEEIKQHQILVKNFNLIMATVYYGSSISTADQREQSFTAFSINYGDNFYIITAGHCVEYEGIKYTDFKFRAHRSSRWLYPNLLDHKSLPNNNIDYAIFSHPSLKVGLIAESGEQLPKYVIGNSYNNLNILKYFNSAVRGESGSPILSSACKVVGVVIKNNAEFTPISVIIEAIEEIENR